MPRAPTCAPSATSSGTCCGWSDPLLKLLWVATKPPWPPVDGGRLLLSNTIEALRAAGHEIEVLAPRGPRPALLAAALSRLRRTAWTIERHRHPGLEREVERRLAGAAPPFDAVIAEQLQSWQQTAGARGRGVRVVLRAQNVESDLWLAAAANAGNRLYEGVLDRESRRVRRAESEACRAAATVAALTPRDAEALKALSGAEARIRVVGAPFPAALPAADHALPGSPALVLVGGMGWLPNRDQAGWFLSEAWPAIRARHPSAVVHVFGARSDAPGVVGHAAPGESREAFAPGAILVVPARIASGLRMKVLEAWARGLPVVASPEAAEGLSTRDGDALLLAREPAAWSAAITRLAAEPALAAHLAAAGRRILATRHDPAAIAAAWAALVEGGRSGSTR